MARELDEGELSRLEEDAASSRAESESGFTGSGSAYSDEVSIDAPLEYRKVPSTFKAFTLRCASPACASSWSCKCPLSTGAGCGSA